MRMSISENIQQPVREKTNRTDIRDKIPVFSFLVAMLTMIAGGV
jgi:hypothetical protein